MTLHGPMLSYVANSHKSAWDDYREVKALSFTVAATVEKGWWHVRRERYHSLARWVDRTFGDGRGIHNAEAPSLEGSGGGIQMLYLATFGDASLDEVQWTNTNGER